MQEIQETVADGFSHNRRALNQSFAVLLALTRKPLTSSELRPTFGMNLSEFSLLLGRLRTDGLVDAVEVTEEEGIRQVLRLTDKGGRVLLREMEQMCELPER